MRCGTPASPSRTTPSTRTSECFFFVFCLFCCGDRSVFCCSFGFLVETYGSLACCEQPPDSMFDLCSMFLPHPYQIQVPLGTNVVVDKENYTQIAMQALLANERTEDFKFLFRVFRELCEGVQPEVSPPPICSV